MQLKRVSEAVRYYLPEHAPFDFQEAYYDDWNTRFLIEEKPRQVGHSMKLAYRAMARMIAIPGYKKIICSMNLEEAHEKIEYAQEFYDAVKERDPVPEQIEDRRLSIKLDNGSRLICAFAPRGRSKADISLDEFAHYADPQKVYVACLPIMVHEGSQMDIGSTTTHSQTFFRQIYRGDNGKYPNFRRESVRWWDCPIHCKNVKKAREKAATMDTEERVRLFGTKTLIEVFDQMPLEDFQRENEMRDTDDGSALLPWELILMCTPQGFEGGEDEEQVTDENRAIDRYFDLEELRAKTKRSLLYGGYDVGRKKDHSELTVLEDKGGILYERYILSINRMPYQEQENLLDRVIAFPNMRRFRIDATGIGQQLAEHCESRFPGVAVASAFSDDSKQTMASNTKVYMEKARVKFYPDKERMQQMHSIKRVVTPHGNLVYKSVGKDHHGDAFWSRALAITAHADLESRGSARITVMTLDDDEEVVSDADAFAGVA